jgi:hypothetical protein
MLFPSKNAAEAIVNMIATHALCASKNLAFLHT